MKTTLLSTLVAAVAALAILATPARSGEPVPARTATEDKIQNVLMYDGVVLVGDSIGVQDGGALERRLISRSGDPIAMDSRARRPTREAVDVLDDWAHRYGLPRRIVLAVGSNDVFDPQQFAAQVDRAMRIAGPDRTVYWVNVYVDRTRQPADVRLADRRGTQWINQVLASARRSHPNLRVVPWAEFVTARPARVATYLRDGVHTAVPAGQDARNELIVRAVTQPE